MFTDSSVIQDIVLFSSGHPVPRWCFAILSAQLHLHWLLGDSLQHVFRIHSWLAWCLQNKFQVFLFVYFTMFCILFRVLLTATFWDFLSFKIRYEEYFLRQFFGSEYEEYSRRVPSGVPFVNWWLERSKYYLFSPFKEKKKEKSITYFLAFCTFGFIFSMRQTMIDQINCFYSYELCMWMVDGIPLFIVPNCFLNRKYCGWKIHQKASPSNDPIKLGMLMDQDSPSPTFDRSIGLGFSFVFSHVCCKHA